MGPMDRETKIETEGSIDIRGFRTQSSLRDEPNRRNNYPASKDRAKLITSLRDEEQLFFHSFYATTAAEPRENQ